MHIAESRNTRIFTVLSARKNRTLDRAGCKSAMLELIEKCRYYDRIRVDIQPD
jgi:hypothetical protein